MTSVQDTSAPLGHEEAMRLAAQEYARLADLLSSLDPLDWARPTCCPPWTVRDMTGHLLGAMRMSASVREQVRQVMAARRHEGSMADGLSAFQVEQTSGLSDREVLAELHELAPRAVRGRRRIPAVARRAVRVSSVLPVSGRAERWSLGYLVGTILTRDAWMHRLDICQAVGREPALTADHDGRLVADIVGEWCRRHGRPVDLTLTGPAGGHFRSGGDAAPLSYDAVEFCRLLSGREGSPVLDTEVPF